MICAMSPVRNTPIAAEQWRKFAAEVEERHEPKCPICDIRHFRDKPGAPYCHMAQRFFLWSRQEANAKTNSGPGGDGNNGAPGRPPIALSTHVAPSALGVGSGQNSTTQMAMNEARTTTLPRYATVQELFDELGREP